MFEYHFRIIILLSWLDVVQNSSTIN